MVVYGHMTAFGPALVCAQAAAWFEAPGRIARGQPSAREAGREEVKGSLIIRHRTFVAFRFFKSIEKGPLPVCSPVNIMSRVILVRGRRGQATTEKDKMIPKPGRYSPQLLQEERYARSQPVGLDQVAVMVILFQPPVGEVF